MVFNFSDFSSELQNEVMNTVPSWMMKETKSELWEEFDDAERELGIGLDMTFFMIQVAFVMQKKYSIEIKMTFSAINFLRFKDDMIPAEFLGMVEAMREEIACSDFEEDMEDTSVFFAEHNHVRV